MPGLGPEQKPEGEAPCVREDGCGRSVTRVMAALSFTLTSGVGKCCVRARLTRTNVTAVAWKWLLWNGRASRTRSRKRARCGRLAAVQAEAAGAYFYTIIRLGVLLPLCYKQRDLGESQEGRKITVTATDSPAANLISPESCLLPAREGGSAVEAVLYTCLLAVSARRETDPSSHSACNFTRLPGHTMPPQC